MKSPKFNSVEEYLASLDATKASTLRSVIDLILAEFQGNWSPKFPGTSLPSTGKGSMWLAFVPTSII
jgi:hypothetical protein